jgi:MoxR-like ATPase
MAKLLNEGKLRYTGKVRPEPGEKDQHGQPLLPYLADQKLIEAVSLTIFLQRPLLIKGEPGCGKTKLAQAVAHELKLPYEAWHVKSTSRARDGLYVYDSLGRLRDAQLAAVLFKSQSESPKPTLDAPEGYIQWGPLGKAFRHEQQTVVLIDEIDKADLDFPNDLLLELDERRFIIEETGASVVAKAPPIVFITSNDEKDLPDAFLRRCIFHYIEFPNRDRLQEILHAHFPESSPQLVGRSVTRFNMLREKMLEDKGEGGKKASTSELIDWFAVLSSFKEDEALARIEGSLPFGSVLLKSWEDHERYLKQEPEGVAEQ